MSKIYAIGDIHGCYKTFTTLLWDKLSIQKSDKIYCLGDYVDRGKDSKGVIDVILNLRNEGYQVSTLRGNHEQMMLDSTTDSESLYLWLQNGGSETLKSFGITSVSELPEQYLSFLKQTELFIATDNYIFVHAGLNFRISDPLSDKEAMLWTRDDYFDGSKINNRLVIHGHTPILLEEVIHPLNPGRINIDGGCVYNTMRGYGNLIALSLPEMTLTVCKNTDG